MACAVKVEKMIIQVTFTSLTPLSQQHFPSEQIGDWGECQISLYVSVRR